MNMNFPAPVEVLTVEERVLWLDQASWEQIMELVRKEEPTSEWFQGELGRYLFETLRARATTLISQDEADVVRWQGEYRASLLEQNAPQIEVKPKRGVLRKKAA